MKSEYEIGCLSRASVAAAKGHLAAQDAFNAGESELGIQHAFLKGARVGIEAKLRVSGQSRRGFTLLELLIVAGIIGILAAIAIPALLRSRMAANESAAIEDIRSVFAERGTGVGEEIRCPAGPGSFSETKAGYVRGCTNGVYWATPLTFGRTGVRGFGMDSSGRICMTMDGSIPNMSRGCVGLQ